MLLLYSYVLVTLIVKGCVKMFPPKTRANVGTVQCVPARYSKTTGGKTFGTRRRASPCNKLKEEGLSMHAKPGSLTCTLTLNIYIIIDKLNGGKAAGICGIYSP